MSNPNTTETDRARAWFNSSGYLLRRLPAACIAECAARGDCGPAVAHWVRRMRFDVPANVAREWLATCGAWDRDELDEADPETLARRVLWLLCCDARERRAEGEHDAQPFGIVN